MSQAEFVPPEAVIAKYQAEKEQRQAEYNEKNRLAEGPHKGRIIKIGEETSRPPKNNPMWVMTIRCKGNEGKNVEEKKIFVKHLDWHMTEFYEIFKMAGYDLKKIKTLADVEDMVNDMLEKFPEVEFNCTHQKDSSYNSYEITAITQCAGEAPATASTTPAEAPAESAKATAKTSTYTEAEILEFDKDECLEVAEELEVALVGKTKKRMQQELIDHINKPAEATPAPAKKAAPAKAAKAEPAVPEASDDDVFPDAD